MLRLLKEARQYWLLMGITVGCIFVLTTAQMTTPSIVRRLTELIETKSPVLVEKAFQLAALAALAYAIQAVATGLRNYLAHKAAWNFVSDMRVKLYNHYQSLSMEFYHDKQIGQLMSRVISDTTNLETLIAHAVPDMAANVILFIGVAILMFFLNAQLALMSLTVLPVLAVTSRWFAKKVRPRMKAGQQIVGELSAELVDNLRS